MNKKLNLARLLLCLLFIQAACHKEDPKPLTELDKLPPATSEGKNTFGCLVNGNAWVPETTIDATAVYQSCIFYTAAGAYSGEVKQRIYIHLQSCTLAKGHYELLPNSPMQVRFKYDDNCTYEDAEVLNGEFNITLIDYQKAIVAGNFSFTSIDSRCDTLKVTDGRFDLTLIL